MNLLQLMVLLEIYDGSFHACQIGRTSVHNTKTKVACDWLIEKGFVHWIGKELWLTEAGKEILEKVLNNIKE